MKEVYEPRLILPPLASESGFEREALHSFVRRVAAINQLPIRSLVLALPFRNSSRWYTKAAYLLNGGGKPSLDLIDAIASCTSIQPATLLGLTLGPLSKAPGAKTPVIKRYRCWCPACYQSDVGSPTGPYDRLVWCIQDVTVCDKHRVVLDTVCPWCRKEYLPFLRSRDICGYCPSCFGWLGGEGQHLHNDEFTDYRLWVANAYADLLNASTQGKLDVEGNLPVALELLAQKHFGGFDAHLAIAIGRAKGNVPRWKHGSVTPSWRVLVEIGFASQTSPAWLISNPHDAVAASQVRALPSSTLRLPRKKSQLHDLEMIVALYRRVEQGECPTLRSITDIARHLNTSARELYRVLQLETRELSRTLAARRSKAASQRREAKRLILVAEVPPAVQRLLSQNKKPTLRAIKRELVTSGVTFDRQSDGLIWQLISNALAGTHANLSGNS